jgi:hypothetical protein
MSSRSCASRLRRAPHEYNLPGVPDLMGLAALAARMHAVTDEPERCSVPSGGAPGDDPQGETLSSLLPPCDNESAYPSCGRMAAGACARWPFTPTIPSGLIPGAAGIMASGGQWKPAHRAPGNALHLAQLADVVEDRGFWK